MSKGTVVFAEKINAKRYVELTVDENIWIEDHQSVSKPIKANLSLFYSEYNTVSLAKDFMSKGYDIVLVPQCEDASVDFEYVDDGILRMTDEELFKTARYDFPPTFQVFVAMRDIEFPADYSDTFVLPMKYVLPIIKEERKNVKERIAKNTAKRDSAEDLINQINVLMKKLEQFKKP